MCLSVLYRSLCWAAVCVSTLLLCVCVCVSLSVCLCVSLLSVCHHRVLFSILYRIQHDEIIAKNMVIVGLLCVCEV
jgi:hypothetical protein